VSELRFTFGKHKGKLIEEIPANYLLWAFDNIKHLDPKIREYIAKNMRALLQEEMEEREDIDELYGLGFGPWEYWKD